jgi:uncharacterized protein YwqG
VSELLIPSSFLANKAGGIPTTHKAKDVMFFKRKQPDSSPPNKEIVALKGRLESHKRTAWEPVTEEGDGGIFSSKFSGLPYLAKNEDWPNCQRCGKEMNLFLQLNLETLPNGQQMKFGEGLLQLFYCTHCDDWKPFSAAHLVRLIEVNTIGSEAHPSLPQTIAPKKIIGWKPFDDYPAWDEWEALGFEAFSDEVIEALEDMTAQDGDKLSGWLYSAQGFLPPACPKCGKTTELVFQIDSNKNLDYMFGDAGCGRITQCPKHEEVLAFSWECY